MMAATIVKNLHYEAPTAHTLVTSGTTTSAEMLKKRLKYFRASHQYFPADIPAYAERFLEHWQPDLCLWLESEIWPNTLRAAKNRNIPMLLLNARLSEKSRIGWAKRPKTAKTLFSAFDEILTADEDTARFLTRALGKDTPVFGNLKMGSPPLPFDKQERLNAYQKFGTSKIWCAASTHKGEEEIMLAAHAKLLETCPNAKLILAPRHPERTDEVVKLIKAQGLDYAKWGQPISNTQSVYLIDTIGKLGTAYAISKLVFMGGSLFPHLSGHNPIEPAQLNCAIFSGPHVSSFRKVYDNFFNAKAARCIEDTSPDKLASQIDYLIGGTPDRDRIANRALQISSADTQITIRLFKRLAPFLKALNRVS